jgi:hypothetical protein
MIERKTVSLDIEDAASRHAIGSADIERYAPPLGCFRSISKRSLSTPTTFLSTWRQLDWGGPGLTFTSLFYELVNGNSGGVPFGCLAVPGAVQPDTIRFLDNNSPDRARIDGMVCIALRAKVALEMTFESGGFDEEYDAGPAAEQIEDMVRQHVALSVYHTADNELITDTVTKYPPAPIAPNDFYVQSQPWVGMTPLAYFDRPNGEFVPIPPLLWRGRDTHVNIGVRKAELGPVLTAKPNILYNNQKVPVNSSAPTTTGDNFITAYAQLSILIEALYVPPPEECGPYWPGELCPPHKLGNHPQYNQSLPVFNRSSELGPSVECVACGSERPTPAPPKKSSKWGILNPKHNLNEAAKQMLLLEDHLFDEAKWCPDCIHKHCLMIEALGDEGVTLDNEAGDAAEWCAKVSQAGKSTFGRIEAGEDKHEVASDLRRLRKELTRQIRAWLDN